jgi:hypothetical protein
MDLPLSIIKDLYNIGTKKWISTIKESTDIFSLTRNLFLFATRYQMHDSIDNSDINFVKSFIEKGEEGIEKLAKLVTLMYLIYNYAKRGDEIDEWGNEEYRSLNPPILVYEPDINKIVLKDMNEII